LVLSVFIERHDSIKRDGLTTTKKFEDDFLKSRF
jgi:hypothetical protein